MTYIRTTAFIGALTFVTPTFAAPITYEAQCVATGLIYGQTFNGVEITLSVLADTANITKNVVKNVKIFDNLGIGTAEIPSFEAVIVAHISSPINMEVNHKDNTIYFRADDQNGIPVVSITNKAFVHYNLQKDIGPIDGFAAPVSGFKFPTNVGNLTINSIQNDMCSFSAVLEE